MEKWFGILILDLKMKRNFNFCIEKYHMPTKGTVKFVILILFCFYSFTSALSDMYQKLLANPDFKPCSPIGCEI
jgi:hypothetical protein